MNQTECGVMSLHNKYFFHNLTEKYITIFGSLFDEIEIKSKNGKSKTKRRNEKQWNGIA